MKKMTGALLCVVCLVVFSGYDWGRKPKSQTPSAEPEQVSTMTQAGESALSSPVANQGVQKAYGEVEETLGSLPRPVVQDRTKGRNSAYAVRKTASVPPVATAPAASANDKAVAIVTLAKIVGTGTPEERKARIESLKRLSQALARSQAQQKV